MSKVKRFTIIAMLLAIAIVLNVLESFTIFIPGVKLGFANIIILIMLYEFKPAEALMVDILRILMVGLLREFSFPNLFYGTQRRTYIVYNHVFIF